MTGDHRERAFYSRDFDGERREAIRALAGMLAIPAFVLVLNLAALVSRPPVTQDDGDTFTPPVSACDKPTPDPA